MRLYRPKRRDEPESILLLINIVFLLLAFFLLAGRVAEPALFAITPPESRGAGAVEGPDLVVLLAADGRLAVGNTPVADAQLTALVRERMRGGDRPPRVTLKADSSINAGRLLAVMESLRQAGVQRVNLATTAAP